MPKRYSPMSRKARVSFRGEGEDDQYYFLTKVATMNGYEMEVNNDLCPEA
jgi:hypothetical protein